MSAMVTCSEREGTHKPMARSIDVIGAADAAEHGSNRLCLMMERSFDMLAEKRRITFDDAKLLLMNAVM